MIQLEARLFRNLEAGGSQAVIDALQSAIKLEHATIPVYLYALYSLDPTKNAAAWEIITSVVIEEMLHMTLACNLLNALGGNPEIDKPGFIPTYPGPLPGGVEGDLTVHLAPFSHDQLADFMKIEEPEDPLHFPVVEARALGPPQTIGQFYAEIKRQITALGDGAFTGPPSKQVGPDRLGGSIVVSDVATASQAIDTIVEQGEGTKESPLEAAKGKQVAHYYRFAEIYNGRRLIPNPAAGPETPPDQRYLYGGDPIPIDASAIYPVPKDPKAETYPAGSGARHACDTFNYAYTSLLKSLHATFNGQPDELDTAIGLMMSLKQLAGDMMSGSNPAGTNVGPSFEYQPVEPA
jgi:hypothetical protein